ncbi:hypothetical protein [Pedobacter faecalis]|uniref:hypothetical protein n=1 Tax=Pedobacter faecalis TaxID=3041495 RepID=UPI00254F2F9D|nr:hypothetical protein [Pedobacter sp. ELA7]
MKNLFCYLIVLLSIQLPAQQKSFGTQVSSVYANVDKLELTIKGGGLSDHYTKFEISNKRGKWYATKQIVRNASANIVTEPGSREIPADSVKRMIHHILNSKEDIDIKLFNLQRDSLIKYFNLSAFATSQNAREKFISRIDNPVILKSALTAVFTQRFMDDNHTYSISVSFSNGQNLQIMSTSSDNPFNLPWINDGKSLYNPNIILSFDYLAGQEAFKRRKSWLYRALVRQLSRLAVLDINQ